MKNNSISIAIRALDRMTAACLDAMVALDKFAEVCETHGITPETGLEIYAGKPSEQVDALLESMGDAS